MFNGLTQSHLQGSKQSRETSISVGQELLEPLITTGEARFTDEYGQETIPCDKCKLPLSRHSLDELADQVAVLFTSE